VAASQANVVKAFGKRSEMGSMTVTPENTWKQFCAHARDVVIPPEQENERILVPAFRAKDAILGRQSERVGNGTTMRLAGRDNMLNM
jgi:hypothetical protein